MKVRILPFFHTPLFFVEIFILHFYHSERLRMINRIHIRAMQSTTSGFGYFPIQGSTRPLWEGETFSLFSVRLGLSVRIIVLFPFFPFLFRYRGASPPPFFFRPFPPLKYRKTVLFFPFFFNLLFSVIDSEKRKPPLLPTSLPRPIGPVFISPQPPFFSPGHQNVAPSTLPPSVSFSLLCLHFPFSSPFLRLRCSVVFQLL